VAAAAQTYFNKSLADLAPHEAAMLAGMPQSPGKFDPVTAKERVTERRNYVLREMWQNGYIDQATYDAEKEMPLPNRAERRFEPSAKSPTAHREAETAKAHRG